MPFLDRPDARVYYEVVRRSADAAAAFTETWVTLINGYTRPLQDFLPLARSLAEQGLSCVLLDNRGAGKTECVAAFSLRDIAEDIVAVWDVLEIPRSAVVGVSFGGTVATTLAAARPERVERLGLISMPCDRASLRIREDHARLSPEELQTDLLRYFSAAYIQKNRLLVDGFIRQMQRLFASPAQASGGLQQRAALRHLNLLPLLEEIAVPTLWIHGSEDRVVPFASAQRASQSLRCGQLLPYEGAGHLLLVEKPKALYADLLVFLSPPKKS